MASIVVFLLVFRNDRFSRFLVFHVMCEGKETTTLFGKHRFAGTN